MEGIGKSIGAALWMMLIIGIVLGIALWVGGGWLIHHFSVHFHW